MKIFKKMAAAVSSAVLAAALCTTVNAEEAVGFDYAPAGGNYAHYDFTAEDGAAGTLTFTKDEDGKLWFSSYEIDAPAPESPEDFPDFKDPDKGYRQFDNNWDFMEYFETNVQKSYENRLFEAIAVKFDLSFDPPLSDGTFSMECSKYYIADLENKTVHYVGHYCISEAIVTEDGETDNVCEYTAEDGTKFYLHFNKKGGGYAGYEAETAPFDFAYSRDGNSQVIISSITVGDIDTGYTLYSDPNLIPLADNEELAKIEVVEYIENESGNIEYAVGVEKYYVITLDGINSKARYAGQSLQGALPIGADEDAQPDPASDFSDGKTSPPNTGNQNSFFAVTLAAAGLAAIAKFAKK